MKKPIRVLCVFSCLDRGGAESMCMNLYRNIDRSKVQFDFVKHTHEKGAFEDEILSLGGKIYEAPRYKIYNHLKYTAWWRSHLKQHPEHKIIHGHYFTISAVYFKVARHMGRITVAHSHIAGFFHFNISFIITRLFELAIERYSDYCFACSEEAGRWLFPKRKFRVLNNAIDTQKFIFSEKKHEEVRKNFGLTNEFVVGHVGRFFPQKNHTFLIDIFKEIHTKNKDSILMLVGDGELRTEIEERVKSLGLSEFVIFIGVRSDVSDIMSAFDAFVFPSLYEGLPVTVVEAQAAGLKCFLSDKVTKEVDLTGRCTFLSIDDPKIWAKKILTDDLTKTDTSKQIKAVGYDIHSTTNWLEDFYVKTLSR